MKISLIIEILGSGVSGGALKSSKPVPFQSDPKPATHLQMKCTGLGGSTRGCKEFCSLKWFKTGHIRCIGRMNVWWTVEMESWLTQTNESSHRCRDLSKLWANLDNTSCLQLCTSIEEGRGTSTYLHLEGRTANFKDRVLARLDICFLLTVPFH